MDELNKRYASLTSQYDQLVQDTLANPEKLDQNVEQVIKINTQISSTLDEMIGILTLAKSSNTDMLVYRDELLAKLAKIQKEYNGLTSNSDKLETLRRIRAFQDESWKSTLRIYLFALIAVVIVVAIVLMFKKSQTDDMTPTMPTSAAMMPPLT